MVKFKFFILFYFGICLVKKQLAQNVYMLLSSNVIELYIANRESLIDEDDGFRVYDAYNYKYICESCLLTNADNYVCDVVYQKKTKLQKHIS